MKPDAVPVDVNDWVYTDSPGVWRVFRVLQGVQKMRFSLQDRKRVDRRRLVFSKRLVDNLWNPAFTSAMANAEFVRPLSAEDQERLEKFIIENSHTLQEFHAFQPKEVDSALDLRLDVPASKGKDGVQRLINDTFAGIGAGLTNDEVLQRLEASPLASYITVMGGNATLRFLSKGHEIQNSEYVFREVQVLMV